VPSAGPEMAEALCWELKQNSLRSATGAELYSVGTQAQLTETAFETALVWKRAKATSLRPPCLVVSIARRYLWGWNCKT